MALSLSAEDIRDAVVFFVDEYERSGRPDWHQRTHMIAYLCHTLGIRGDRLHRDVAGLVGEYDLACKDQSCKHELQ